MIRKNDRVSVTIEDYSAEGHGVARADGFVLFIPGGVVGDRVTAHVMKCGKHFGYAKIVDILSPSPLRIPSDCAESVRCGGCVFRELDYAEECRRKAERVKQDLIRIGGIDTPPMQQIIAADRLTGYRNKAQYPVREQSGDIAAGFYAAGSHRVIPCAACKIQPGVFDDILRFVLRQMKEHHISAYNETTDTGAVRHLYLRRGEQSGEIMVCFVLRRGKLPQSVADELQAAFPDIRCICVNINPRRTNVILGEHTEFLTERTYITDTLLGKVFAIAPESFFQVNPVQTEKLYALAARLADVKDTDTVLDLYCGIGSVGICAAGNAKALVGIEIVPQAIKNAEQNAVRNHMNNTRYLCADAKVGAGQLMDEGYHFTTVFVDPPRKGCDSDTLQAILSLAPEKLVYISCDPATLARDIAVLTQNGFALQSATPVDLFPRTTHVECVTLLTKVHK